MNDPKLPLTNQQIFEKITAYADTVLADIDPQKTPISVQLDKLRPVMAEIAREENTSLEDIFIKYMDMATEASARREQEFQSRLNN